MNIEYIINLLSSINLPLSSLLLCPISIAICLQILRSSSNQVKLHTSGTWKGLEMKESKSNIAPLVAIISIVFINYANVQKATDKPIIPEVIVSLIS